MLQRSIEQHRGGERARAPALVDSGSHAEGEVEFLLGMFNALRRNLKLIVGAALIGTVITTVAVFMITPQYLATVTILVDPRQMNILQDAEVVSQLQSESRNAGVVDSEVELMRSDAVLRRAAERLGLDNADEFSGPSGLVSRLRALVLLPLRAVRGGTSDGDALSAAAANLARNTFAKRRGATYVIDLSAWSRDPEMAARIANAIAEAYLADQLAAKAEATKRANEWLNRRVDEMRGRVAASEEALENYRAEAGLAAVFRTNLEPGGQRLADQQISKLSEQLVAARAEAAQARAKYDRLREITPEQLRSAAASPDVLKSTVVSSLRAQYADAARHQAEWTARYGPGHPQVVAGRAQVSDLERQISAEINRIVSSARTEYEMAKSREVSLAESLEELQQRSREFDQAAIKLRELEREAETNRELFKSFLARAKQTAELDMQVPDSRIVSLSAVPSNPRYPRKSLFVGLGFIGSLGLAVAFVVARDALRRFGKGFRHSFEIETMLGLHPLVSIPRVDLPLQLASKNGGPAGNRGLLSIAAPAWEIHKNSPRPSQAAMARTLVDMTLDQPDSAFAESIRSLYFSLKHQATDLKVAAVTSTLPGEGKSTVAANLARVAAEAGDRVLLLESDLRRPSLAHLLNLGRSPGLAGLLSGEANLEESVRRDERTNLYAIAGVTRVSGARAISLLSSKRMEQLVTLARESFDLIVIDTPPLLPVADTRILADLVDGFVMIVASETTNRDAVIEALRESPGVEEKVIGVVLNGIAGDFDRYYRDRGESLKPAVA